MSGKSVATSEAPTPDSQTTEADRGYSPQTDAEQATVPPAETGQSGWTYLLPQDSEMPPTLVGSDDNLTVSQPRRNSPHTSRPQESPANSACCLLL
jgi:hypothetical protein